jgi:hypothetical protein
VTLDRTADKDGASGPDSTPELLSYTALILRAVANEDWFEAVATEMKQFLTFYKGAPKFANPKIALAKGGEVMVNAAKFLTETWMASISHTVTTNTATQITFCLQNPHNTLPQYN